MARSAILNVMVQAAMKAGRSLARDFGEVASLQVSIKGPGDFVSSADRRAEQIIHAELAKARPSYGFLMEESGAIAGSDPQHRWIVDPLDGTTNFLHGIPLFCVSIALERQGRLMAGVVLNPATDELYVAERGGGAYLNDRRLRVSARKQLEDALVCTDVPHVGRGGGRRAVCEFAVLMPETAGIRGIGAVALELCWIAAGRLDGLWQYDLGAWDVAAGAVVLREAGGFATDARGGDTILSGDSLVAGNEAVHAGLLRVLRAAREGARTH